MSDSKNLIGYAGVYEFVDDAQDDFGIIKEAHRKSWIGAYDAALFMKSAEGKVKVLNIDATERATGAKAGAIVGAVLGVIFPPSILLGATVGAACGAAAGNLAKGFGKGDIKDFGAGLNPGEAGILLIADATYDAGAEKLLKRAKRYAKHAIDADAKDLKAALG